MGEASVSGHGVMEEFIAHCLVYTPAVLTYNIEIYKIIGMVKEKLLRKVEVMRKVEDLKGNKKTLREK
jgi:hypothetical protein